MIRASTTERTSSALIGVASLGFGIAAVFRTENQAGAVVLVLMGAIFLLVTVSGLIPAYVELGEDPRFKIGMEDAERKTDEASPYDKSKLVDQANNAPPGDPNKLGVYSGVAKEYQFLSALVSALPPGFRLLGKADTRGLSFDAVIEDADQQRIAIEYKSFSSPIDIEYVHRLASQISTGGGTPMRALLAGDPRPPDDVLAYMRDQKIHYVHWTPDVETDVLQNYILDAVRGD